MSVPGSPSPEAADLAARKGFGRLEHTFLPRKELDVRDGRRGLFMAGAIAGTAALGAGGVLLWTSYSRILALYPLFLTVLAVGALVKSPNFRRKVAGRRLHLFEQGLLVDSGGGRLFALRWEHAVHYQATVQEVIEYKGTTTPFKTSHVSTLVAPDGTRFDVTDSFADHGTWLPLIGEAIARAQAQRVWDAVRGGRKAAHGPFTLDATGISSTRGGTLSWSAVEAVDVSGGAVIVRRAGQPKPWARAEVKTVPNLLLFLTLAARLRRA
ncbi:DUF6585 family protein [Streptomyces subrutilus]|uniref:DUF6585 family protein n=1 Tax=Streptomyces subrutilus TaxID=36818 RepID=UPI003443DFE0